MLNVISYLTVEFTSVEMKEIHAAHYSAYSLSVSHLVTLSKLNLISGIFCALKRIRFVTFKRRFIDYIIQKMILRKYKISKVAIVLIKPVKTIKCFLNKNQMLLSPNDWPNKLTGMKPNYHNKMTYKS